VRDDGVKREDGRTRDTISGLIFGSTSERTEVKERRNQE
jgi:hypothetical protein